MNNKDFQNGLIVGLAKGGGGGSSVQPDYLQNDPAAKDYIKNRPFYTETKAEINRDIIPSQEVEGVYIDVLPEGYLIFSIDSIQEITNIVDKGQYNLTIDGVTEQITTTFNPDMEALLFGNLSIMGLGDKTDETYIGMMNIHYDKKDGFQTSFQLVLQTTKTTHTIGLSHIGDAAPIIAENKYSFENIDGTIGCSFTNIWETCFEEDSVYNLTFNGEFYRGLSWSYHEASGMSYLGNLSIPGIGDDSKENYCILRIEQGDGSVMLVMATSCEADDYTVSLGKSLVKTTEIVHKIDNKYLDISHIENNLDKLNNSIGTSYDEQLYKRYGINRSEYPCITIKFGIRNIELGVRESLIELYFSERPPMQSIVSEVFVFDGDSHYKRISLVVAEVPAEDVELKTIINFLIQASDFDIKVEEDDPNIVLSPSSKDYIYYNYKDTAINELTNSSRLDLDLPTLQSEVYNIKNTLVKNDLIINSTSEGSTKKFKITVNDDGVINTVEVAE